MLETQTIHAPELPNNSLWLNSAPLHLKALRGSVVLIDFWDYTCVNCARTLPYVIEWADKYKKSGLTVIGVHAPEFEFARQSKQIEQACAAAGITYPVVLDNDYAIWQSFDNKGWPSKFLIDAQGYIRYGHLGEGEYLATEMAIQAALREARPDTYKPQPFCIPKRGEDAPGALCYRPTPELQLGYERSDVGNPEGVEKNTVMLYADPGIRENKHAYLHGAWRSRDEYLELAGASGRIAFIYQAKEVNVVMSPTGDAVQLMLEGQGAVLLGQKSSVPTIHVLQDGAPLGAAHAGADIVYKDGHALVCPDRPRMMRLVNNPGFEAHELSLEIHGAGFAAYAVSFTTCVGKKE